MTRLQTKFSVHLSVSVASVIQTRSASSTHTPYRRVRVFSLGTSHSKRSKRERKYSQANHRCRKKKEKASECGNKNEIILRAKNKHMGGNKIIIEEE